MTQAPEREVWSVMEASELLGKYLQTFQLADLIDAEYILKNVIDRIVNERFNNHEFPF